MKRTKNLIILIAFLAVAIAVYFIASAIAKREEEKNEVPEETVITIVDKEASEVAAVDYTSLKSNYSIELSSSTYYISGDREFPLDQTKATAIFESAASVSFKKQVSETDGKSGEYGLDDPTLTLCVKYSDTSELKLNIGDINEGAGGYYVNIDGESSVYLAEADFVESFDYLYTDLLIDETPTEPEDGFNSVTKIEVDFSDGSGYSYTYTKNTIDDSETDEEESEDEDDTPESYFAKHLADGTTVEGDFSGIANKLYDEIFALNPSIWVAYGITEDSEKAEYGLDTPFVKVTFTYEETVEISNSDGSTSTVTKVVEKTTSVLFGDISREDEAEPDSSETDSSQTTDTEASENDTAESVTEDTTDNTDDTSTDESQDNTESEEETERFFITGDGKIVYLIPESDVPSLFDAK